MRKHNSLGNQKNKYLNNITSLCFLNSPSEHTNVYSALRQEMHGEKHVQCRCDNRKVPYLTDVELDKYLTSLPKTQLVVLSIVSSDLSSTG